MHWSELLVYGLGGGIGGGLGAVLVRKFPGRKWLMPLTVVLSITLFKIVFLSWTETKKTDDAAEQALQSVSVYRAIQGDDPTFYADLKQRFAAGLREGKIAQVMADDVAGLLGSRFQRYVRITSNEAAVHMTRATVDMLEGVDGETCYALMFPARNAGKINTYGKVPVATKNEVMLAMSQVVETAIKNPQPAATQNETQPALEKALGSLPAETLQGLQSLNHAISSSEEKGRACDASTKMFRKILEQPEAEAGPLLRFLMGS